MTEIEKLFENAGFPKKQCKDYSCTVCEQYNNCEKYLPFTAEKQLKLIKWLGDTDYYINNIYKTTDTKEYCIENCYYDMQSDKFEETLAKLINKMWQNLTDQEKEEIRNILK